ncbi:MAG: hypothetical protein U9O54_00315 [Chloroflexota bacterium]|nr:hypothetical protein [Chloroflexota bacterium]
MKKIEVTAQFTASGKIIPHNFSINKNSHRVHSSGRQWEDETGKHFLVMDIHAQTYHLLFSPQECAWYIVAGSQSPAVSV